MNIPLLSKLFNKQKPSLQSLESILVSKLKKFAKEHDYPLFENIPIFYRSQKMILTLALFIPKTGLILFEYKDWTYEELRNAKVSKASHVQKAEESLSFESLGEFIKEKFTDLTTFDDIDIFNFVIMEQLREEEFNLLDESFHALLPKERILFQDSALDIIERKFKTLPAKQKTYTVQNTLPFIFSQYMILDGEKVYFANEEQRRFLDKKLQKNENLTADRQSGKTTLLLQKAILEKLENQKNRIAIITPTRLQKELLRQTLLDLVEHSSVVLDMNDIALYTPDEIQNSQKKILEHVDMIFIDDAFALQSDFLASLKQLSKYKTLLFINAPGEDVTFSLSRHYYGEIAFLQAAEFPTLLKQINTLFSLEPKSDALIFTKEGDFEAIKEDIEGFCAQPLSFVDTDESVQDQTQSPLKLGNYNLNTPLHASYTFLLDGCQSDLDTLEYLAKSSKIKSFILHQEECDTIVQLKARLENNDAEDNQK